MSIINAFILGLIQGLTEFLPISSSAHLGLVPALANWEEQSIEYDLMLHLASLFALIIYFRNDLLYLIKNFNNKETKDFLIKIIISILPLLPFYLFFKDLINESQSFSIITIILLIVFGILLIFIDKKKEGNLKEIKDITIKDAIIIGCFQCLALFSGVSRSGITITAAILIGLSEFQSKKYSFLLSIPTIFIAFIVSLIGIDGNSGVNLNISISLVIALLTTFFSGLFALHILFKFNNKIKLRYYGYYRIILGIVLLFILFQ